MKNNSRRNFIANTAKSVFAIGVGSHTTAFLQSCNGPKKIVNKQFTTTAFTQQPLPYSYNALEDVIDATTMEIHYSKHAATYAKNLNEAAKTEGIDTNKSVEAILNTISKYSTKIRNNAGGHFNHELFWQCMQPKQNDNKPTNQLLATIEKTFGSFADFKTKFTDAGKTRFGSGWAWLYVDADKNLKIGSTPNQDNPLMDISEIKGNPLLTIDVWEHAYYLKYQNKRADYIENWWNVVNWNYVANRFNASL
jgi:superoxide dismutase, Fe-Mn family